MPVQDADRLAQPADLLREVSGRGVLAALEESPSLVVVWAGSPLRLVFCNREARAVVGALPLGVSAAAAYPEFPDYVATLERVASTGEASAQRHSPAGVVRSGSGSSRARTMDVALAPLRDDLGLVVGVVAQAVDVTHRYADDDGVRTALVMDQAGQELSRSLEVEQVTRTVTRLAAEVFSGWAILDLWGSDGALERVAVTHHDPRLQPVISRLKNLPRVPGRTDGHLESYALRAASTGRVASGRYDVEAVAGASPSAESAEVIRQLEPEWFVCVPVEVGPRRLGALSVVRPRGQAPFTAADQAVLEQLAARAGVALAHARDYDEQRQAALTLQRHLLPEQPQRRADVEIAVRYQAGGVGSEVGGDWYDVVELDDASLGIAVGDVEGHDLAAAALMGQVRAIVHSHATAGLPPARIARAANAFLVEAPSERLVTLDYLQVYPRQGLLVGVRAGHVPALVVPAHGAPRVLDGRGGLPLGVDAHVRWQEETVHLPPGALVAVLTDGLVETPERDVDAGLEQLAALLAGHAGRDLDVVADEVLSRMTAGAARDDVAFVLLRLPGGDGAEGGDGADGGDRGGAGGADLDGSTSLRTVTRRLPAAVWAASLFRRFAGDVLAHWGVDDEVAEVAGLLLTEIASNAARHSDEGIELRMTSADGTLRVSVFDDSHRLPQWSPASVEDTSGRGLQLVDTLSQRWGVVTESRGKRVWFELPFRPFARESSFLSLENDDSRANGP